MKKGFVENIEKRTLENTEFRRVLYTGEQSQLVLMSLLPKQEIGEEIHEHNDQFFRIERGQGDIIINGNTTHVEDGSAIVVPKGATHNLINTGDVPLQLYTIYCPPHHQDQTIHQTKEIAESSDEQYDGITTE